jgi:hypothetical protein
MLKKRRINENFINYFLMFLLLILSACNGSESPEIALVKFGSLDFCPTVTVEEL